jgi:hypothetical protein
MIIKTKVSPLGRMWPCSFLAFLFGLFDFVKDIQIYLALQYFYLKRVWRLFQTRGVCTKFNIYVIIIIIIYY